LYVGVTTSTRWFGTSVKHSQPLLLGVGCRSRGAVTVPKYCWDLAVRRGPAGGAGGICASPLPVGLGDRAPRRRLAEGQIVEPFEGLYNILLLGGDAV